MKKSAFFASVTFLAALAAAPYTYILWPSGKAQDYALIWVKGDKIAELFLLADKFEYERIHFCRKGPEPYWVEAKGKRKTVSDEDANFSQFKAAVIDAGLPCFWAQKNNGNWSVPGFNNVHFITTESGKIKQNTFHYYVYSHANIDSTCTNKVFESSSLERCTNKLFGNWYAGTEILSAPCEDVDTQT